MSSLAVFLKYSLHKNYQKSLLNVTFVPLPSTWWCAYTEAAQDAHFHKLPSWSWCDTRPDLRGTTKNHINNQDFNFSGIQTFLPVNWVHCQTYPNVYRVIIRIMIAKMYLCAQHCSRNFMCIGFLKFLK